MGKKQHQSDKLYLTSTEWSTLYGGKKVSKPDADKAEFRRLPFDACSLTLQPFENPLCTEDGCIFDLMNIVPFLKKYGRHPVTGEKLDAKSLIRLKFHKNASGKYHCPVMFNVFNKNSHIVAIKTTGNVYSKEAIDELNIKNKNWKDLLTDEPFARKDIIVLQDPQNLDKFNISKFQHLKKDWKVAEEDKVHAKYYLKNANAETEDILAELSKTYKAPEAPKKSEVRADHINAAHYSTGAVAASFTATSMDRVTHSEAAIIDEDEIRYKRIKKKGYLRIVTNKGPLNLELHCDYVPKTCENFVKLSQKGYYDDTIFHRSIKNFMIQGGDPQGTGKGGESYWGAPFKDEFKTNLTHSGRGVLSMANSGPDSNKSQFFITFRSCRHLDNKHTVFGRLVGGLETLQALESVHSDPKTDRPAEELKIQNVIVFVNPFDEVDEQLKQEREEAAAKRQLEEEERRKEELRNRRGKTGARDSSGAKNKVFRGGVGKYISQSQLATNKRLADAAGASDVDAPSENKKKKTSSSGGFGDFSSW